MKNNNHFLEAKKEATMEAKLEATLNEKR